jgi:lipopolysaccharide transport system permease protein
VKETNEEWTIVIKPHSGLFDIDFKEILQYRDLLMIFIRRDLIGLYKQTLLGPLWFFIQPILTTIVYVVVYGGIMQLKTDSKPQILFYLSGIVLWNYFADCLIATSNTFINNAAIFGKVYFPRVILPLSKVISNLLKMFIQLLLLVIAYGVFLIMHKFTFELNWYILTLPLLIIIMANLGLGLGMIVTSLTTKYRDLQNLIVFGVQLMMFAAPIIYPLSKFEHTRFHIFFVLNPVTAVVETFRASVLGGSVDLKMLAYSFVVSLVLLIAGFLIFNKVERSFIDTV